MSINELFFHNTVGTDTVAVSKYFNFSILGETSTSTYCSC